MPAASTLPCLSPIRRPCAADAAAYGIVSYRVRTARQLFGFVVVLLVLHSELHPSPIPELHPSHIVIVPENGHS